VWFKKKGVRTSRKNILNQKWYLKQISIALTSLIVAFMQYEATFQTGKTFGEPCHSFATETMIC
jgi:hypothetical protein